MVVISLNLWTCHLPSAFNITHICTASNPCFHSRVFFIFTPFIYYTMSLFWTRYFQVNPLPCSIHQRVLNPSFLAYLLYNWYASSSDTKWMPTLGSHSWHFPSSSSANFSCDDPFSKFFSIPVETSYWSLASMSKFTSLASICEFILLFESYEPLDVLVSILSIGLTYNVNNNVSKIVI